MLFFRDTAQEHARFHYRDLVFYNDNVSDVACDGLSTPTFSFFGSKMISAVAV